MTTASFKMKQYDSYVHDGCGEDVGAEWDVHLYPIDGPGKPPAYVVFRVSDGVAVGYRFSYEEVSAYLGRLIEAAA